MRSALSIVTLCLMLAGGLVVQHAKAHGLNPAVLERLTGSPGPHTDHHQITAATNDPRGLTRTFTTYPEWYIVYSAKEYGDFIQTGNHPTDFPYFAAIGQFWDSYRFAYQRAGAVDSTTDTVLKTIGLSFTLEYAVIGLYENTIGRVSSWLNFGVITAEDRVTEQAAIAYGTFLYQTPWYDFPYFTTLKELWTTFTWESLTIRALERRAAFTIGYTLKGTYGWAIRSLSDTQFGEAALTTTATVRNLSASTLEAIPDVSFVTNSTDTITVRLPRYRAALLPLVKMVEAGGTIETIEEHTDIMLTTILTTDTLCDIPESEIVFTETILTNPTQVRSGIYTSVSNLATVLSSLNTCNATIEHLYDY